MADTPLTDMMTLKEAAAYVRRSTRTVRRWIHGGDLRGAVRLKQTLLVPRSALDDMVKPVGIQ